MRALAMVVAAALAAAPAAAADFEIGILGGVQYPDHALTGSGPDADHTVPTIGARADLFLSKHWGLFVDGLWSAPASDRDFGDATLLHGRAGPEIVYPAHFESQQFYLAGGLGLLTVDLDEGGSFDRPYYSLGLGSRWRVGERLRFRIEVRGDETFGDVDDDVARRMEQVEVLAGISWGLGGSSAPDADRDGVPDARDRCPSTPRGAVVDAHGCPVDSDVDGVFDGLDRCPDTPSGAWVDEVGCPADDDRDGVLNGLDRCPNTPAGARVDATGCMAVADADGDGVSDAEDRCPDTPAGVEVDAAGCPKVVRLFGGQDAGAEIVLEGVRFATSSARLTPASLSVLDRVARSLVAWPKVRVEIGGHTDSRGPRPFNLDLSRRRAEAVKAYLVRKGVAPERLRVRGYGPDEPVADNATAEGRRQNRRVELTKL